MAHKVFVSYKYADDNVQQLYQNGYYYHPTTVRDFVSIFEEKVKKTGIAIYKGESDGEDISHLSEDEIWSRLRDKIFDSSVTIVFISAGMRNQYLPDRNQWIPWEVAFSLRNQTRADRISRSNALLYVILPDRNGTYYYELFYPSFRIIEANRRNEYALEVEWHTFINNISYYIEQAIAQKDKVPNYLVCKQV